MGEEPKNEYELARIRTWNLLIRSQTRYPLRHKPRDEKWHSSQTIHTRRPCVSDLLFVWREIWTECCTVWQIRLISRAFCSNLYPIWMIRAFVHHSYWISFLRECFVWPTWLIHAYLKVYWMTIGVRLELWSQTYCATVVDPYALMHCGSFLSWLSWEKKNTMYRMPALREWLLASKHGF